MRWLSRLKPIFAPKTGGGRDDELRKNNGGNYVKI